MSYLAAFSLIVASGGFDVDPKALQAVERMLDRWTHVQRMTFDLKKKQRLKDGTTTQEEMFVKNRQPSDFYLANRGKLRGQEVIYSGRRDKERLIAHRGSFPDITVKLDIGGGMATDDQHHPVTHSGLGYLLHQIEGGILQAQKSPSGERLEYGGKTTLFSRPAVRVVLRAGSATFRTAVAPKDQTVWAFAKAQKCDPYLIVYYNDGLDDLTDSVDAGETYKIPRYYGQKTEIIIDAATNLPLRVRIWDISDNLYEEYSFQNMRINPPLSDLDFDPENPAYDF